MKRDLERLLRERGIQPSAQRLAVADYVLRTEEHPCADLVWSRVGAKFPMLSRATVYNTLNLFVEKGLLRQLFLTEGKTVFDPNLAPHHHLIDDVTGEIVDLPWEAVKVARVDAVPGYEIREVSVVLRGRRASTARAPSSTGRRRPSPRGS